MWHKLGDYCINGTDNIIISMFLSVAVVGYYSNYLMLLNLIGGYIGMIFSSMTASMGNVIATEGNEKRLEIFENINFLGFWLYSFSAICFYNLLNPFIELWLGKEYLLSQHVVLVLVLNNYMAWMRIPPYTVKSANGLYSEDQFVPIIQSILNLVISVVLAKSIGLIGVFIGTAVSGILPSLYRPYLIYKKVFKTTSIFYYIEYCKNMSLMIGLSFFIYYLIEILNIGGVIGFIINLIICILVPNVVYLLIFRKKREFVYIYNIFKSILLGLKKRI